LRARVVRLAVTSVIALGLILGLWAVNRPGGPWVGAALGAGWALMPAVLLLMLRVPKARYALVVPSTLISVALVDVALVVRSAGWAMVASGILLGGLLGAWFWFRLLPVPRPLRDPFGPGRWALIAVHVGLIVAGMALVALSAL
jgi:hypothetical protein